LLEIEDFANNALVVWQKDASGRDLHCIRLLRTELRSLSAVSDLGNESVVCHGDDPNVNSGGQSGRQMGVADGGGRSSTRTKKLYSNCRYALMTVS
jgi:hypothetical protein